MTDQPMPTPGRTNVTPVARRVFFEILDAQERKGIAKYSTTLQTDNGRDALMDASQECVDLFQYIVQARLERQSLEDENARLRAELAELRGQP